MASAVIGRPGVLNSAAIQEPLRPLWRLEGDAGRAHEEALKSWKAEHLIGKERAQVARMSNGASGANRPITGTSTSPPSPPSSVPDGRPRARCHGPVTPKHADALRELQATCQERLPRVMPPTHTWPVRVCSQDASRLGCCRDAGVGSRPMGSNRLGRSSPASTGALSMAPSPQPPASAASWHSPRGLPRCSRGVGTPSPTPSLTA
jgi:hypothetical protein